MLFSKRTKLKVSIFSKNRIEDVVKRVQKTYSLARKLMSEITGLLYDLKELLTVYRGNLIALVIGIAIPIFNMHRNNPGKFSSYSNIHCLKILFDV